MVRTLAYLLGTLVVLGTVATPGLAAFALVVAPLLGMWLVWRTALTVFTHGRPIDAVVHTTQSHLLGPGGPDDSFAGPLNEDGYPAGASTTASTSARNGHVQGANIPRPSPSELLPVRLRGDNSVQEIGG